MIKVIPAITVCILMFSCKEGINTKTAKNEIFQTEKDFEKMVSEKGMAEAFYFFAAEDAAILRKNDSLITGRENIRQYYVENARPNVKLTWTPDYIDVSQDGTLGYTYGKYTYYVKDSTGMDKELKGVFHTVWKKNNNGWRYVWD